MIIWFGFGSDRYLVQIG